ncbi:MAG: hypothetical protein JWO67_6932 [Streptosporangiaceae bacterium]|nr:hypothetical protein [Streptosporangiaceae bacterium]
MAEQDHNRVERDWPSVVLALYGRTLPYAFYFCLVFFGLPHLAPLLQTIAGKETVFKFDVALNVSISLNIALGGVLVAQRRSNKALSRQLRQAERERPSLAPQSEQLPLQGSSE